VYFNIFVKGEIFVFIVLIFVLIVSTLFFKSVNEYDLENNHDLMHYAPGK
jgi:hypothetical protein